MTRIEVGDTIHGFAGGHFGRNTYHDKFCIQTGFYDGARYAVFYEDGWHPTFHVIAAEDLSDLENGNYTSSVEKEY